MAAALRIPGSILSAVELRTGGGENRQTRRDGCIATMPRAWRVRAVRVPPGAKPKLTTAQKAELARLVEAGPDRAMAWCAGGASICATN